jgi:hypothetical protein
MTEALLARLTIESYKTPSLAICETEALRRQPVGANCPGPVLSLTV